MVKSARQCFGKTAEEHSGSMSVRGKAAVCALAMFLVFCTVFIYMEFFTGHVRNAKVRFNESEKYSQEELSEAVAALKRELFWKMWGCELQEVAYREWIDYNVSKEEQKEAGIGREEDFIILETKSVVTYDFCPLYSGSMVEGARDDMEWVLVRNKETGRWRVAGALGGG